LCVVKWGKNWYAFFLRFSGRLAGTVDDYSSIAHSLGDGLASGASKGILSLQQLVPQATATQRKKSAELTQKKNHLP